MKLLLFSSVSIHCHTCERILFLLINSCSIRVDVLVLSDSQFDVFHSQFR